MLESTPDALPSVDLIHVQRYIPSVRNSFRTLNKQTKKSSVHPSFLSLKPQADTDFSLSGFRVLSFSDCPAVADWRYSLGYKHLRFLHD